jgi:hypothetical protein
VSHDGDGDVVMLHAANAEVALDDGISAAAPAGASVATRAPRCATAPCEGNAAAIMMPPPPLLPPAQPLLAHAPPRSLRAHECQRASRRHARARAKIMPPLRRAAAALRPRCRPHRSCAQAHPNTRPKKSRRSPGPPTHAAPGTGRGGAYVQNLEICPPTPQSDVAAAGGRLWRPGRGFAAAFGPFSRGERAPLAPTRVEGTPQVLHNTTAFFLPFSFFLFPFFLFLHEGMKE